MPKTTERYSPVASRSTTALQSSNQIAPHQVPGGLPGAVHRELIRGPWSHATPSRPAPLIYGVGSSTFSPRGPSIHSETSSNTRSVLLLVFAHRSESYQGQIFKAKSNGAVRPPSTTACAGLCSIQDHPNFQDVLARALDMCSMLPFTISITTTGCASRWTWTWTYTA